MSDLVPMVPRMVGPRPRQSRLMFCESEVLLYRWDAPWYRVRTSLVPRPVMQPVAKRPIVSDPFQ